MEGPYAARFLVPQGGFKGRDTRRWGWHIATRRSHPGCSEVEAGRVFGRVPLRREGGTACAYCLAVANPVVRTMLWIAVVLAPGGVLLLPLLLATRASRGTGAEERSPNPPPLARAEALS